jgi:hypothetical protein
MSLVLLGLEAGCGAQGANVAAAAPGAARSSETAATAGAAAPPPSPAPAPPRSPAMAKEVNDAPHSAAMLVYTANLSLAVFQVTEGMDSVEEIGRDVAGYLSNRGDSALTIRVPRDHFRDAVSRIERLGDVIHRDIKAEDVTDAFVDLAARLKNAYAMRDRLVELLHKATVKEAIDIQKELGRITEQIEQMEGQMKLLQDKTAFSTIAVSFSPVQDQTVHDTTLLAPFPWLEKLGLQVLLNVHQ